MVVVVIIQTGQGHHGPRFVSGCDCGLSCYVFVTLSLFSVNVFDVFSSYVFVSLSLYPVNVACLVRCPHMFS